MVHQDGVQRGLWKLGVIESVTPSTDGAVRAVKVRTTTKAGRTTHLNRPVQRLYPVEQAVSIGSGDQPSMEETGRDIEALRRPRRRAAKRANEERRLLLDTNRLEHEFDAVTFVSDTSLSLYFSLTPYLFSF